MHVATLEGDHILRRRINLLSGGGTVMKGLSEDLKAEELGIDVDWSKVIRDGMESVLDAHRNGLVLVSVMGAVQRPLPPQWLCDGLVLKNKINCWLGAAGTGKSTLAKALCAHYAAGEPFLGRRTDQGVPIYLDWEDDEDDLRRVAHDVCRGLGVWPVPEIIWVNMRGKRLRDNVERLAREIDRRQLGLMVMDAIAAAGGSPGEHMSWEAVALELEQCLGQLPPITVVGLDHVTSEEHKQGGAAVPMKGRGAERKVEFIRNQWSLVLDRGELEYGRHIVSWHNTKINATLPQAPFTTEILHQDGAMSIEVKGIEASPAAVERMPFQKQNVLYVRENPGKTVEHIAMAVRNDSTKAKIDMTRKELQRAQKKGEVFVDDAGRWWPKTESRMGSTDLPFDSGQPADKVA
jgi:hypothetical protein